MSSTRPAQRFADIVKAADRVLSKTEGVSRETFEAEWEIHWLAERGLAIISEAAVKLGAEAEQRVPDVPWASIRGMGNFLRHEYDNVQVELIWTLIANGQLRALRDACAPHAAPRDA